MKHNKKGFSLVIAMGLVLVTSLLAYTMLEYIIPFSKNVKGIENSTKAFYKANDGIENGLYHISTRTDLRSESGSTYSGDYSTKFNMFSSGSKLPLNGKGNSEFDTTKNWNRIALGEPIQLSIGNGAIGSLNGFKVYFDEPLGLTLSGVNSTEYINWQLTSEFDALNASGSLITKNDIDGLEIRFDLLNGSKLDGTQEDFDTYYTTNCGSLKDCTLKFSIINKLVTSGGKSIPYLDWKMEFDSGDNIPLRYTTIESSGKSYGFKKDLEVKVPQETVSEAFDFTVFQ